MFNMVHYQTAKWLILIFSLFGGSIHNEALLTSIIDRKWISFKNTNLNRADVFMRETHGIRFLPDTEEYYSRLIDGKKKRSDTVFFWTDKKKMCLHLYTKEFIFLKEVYIYIHPEQVKKVGSVEGLLADGMSQNVSRRLVATSYPAGKYDKIVMKPECSHLSEMAMVDRLRICMIFNATNVYFAFNEVELFGVPFINEESNLVKFRTPQAAMPDCSIFQPLAPPRVVRKAKPAQSWQVPFEAAVSVKSVSALVAIMAGQDPSDLQFASFRLKNTSILAVPPDRCRWSRAPEYWASKSSALLQWKQARCDLDSPTVSHLLLTDALRVANVVVNGRTQQYPTVTIRVNNGSDFKVCITCDLSMCSSFGLELHDAERGFQPVVSKGRLLPDGPFVREAINISERSDGLKVCLPQDYHHTGRYRCTCLYQRDGAVLTSRAVNTKVAEGASAKELILNSVFAKYILDYKFTWNTSVPFIPTTLSYILWKPQTEHEIATRMRIFSYIRGKDNASVQFERYTTSESRPVKICRAPGERFCVDGYEFLQGVSYHRLHDDLRSISIPVWLGFINEWHNYTIHLHKEGFFDFWVRQQDAESIKVDMYCPGTASCSGNLSQISTTCSGSEDVRHIGPIQGEHNDLVEIDGLDPLASYRLCLQRDDQERCKKRGEGGCGKCVDIQPEASTEGHIFLRVLSLRPDIYNYTAFNVKGRPEEAIVGLWFAFKAAYLRRLICNQVVPEAVTVSCEDGHMWQRKIQSNELKTILVPKVPLAVTCNYSVTMGYNSSNATFPMTTNFNTRHSPLVSFQLDNWSNKTHALLDWASDLKNFPRRFLRRYRIQIIERGCDGRKTTSEELMQNRTRYIRMLVKTSIYTFVVFRDINFNSSNLTIKSDEAPVQRSVKTFEQPKIDGVFPLNRNQGEAEITFDLLKGCLPTRVEAMWNDMPVPASITEARDPLRVIVDTSKLPAMNTGLLKIRILFGLYTSPWTDNTGYQIPFDGVITNSVTGALAQEEIELLKGTSTEYMCACRGECPDGISYTWHRGWVDGDVTGNGEQLVLKNLEMKDSGRYVCAYRKRGNSSDASQLKVAASIMLIVKEPAPEVAPNSRPGGSAPYGFAQPSGLVAVGICLNALARWAGL